MLSKPDVVLAIYLLDFVSCHMFFNQYLVFVLEYTTSDCLGIVNPSWQILSIARNSLENITIWPCVWVYACILARSSDISSTLHNGGSVTFRNGRGIIK